MSGCTSIIDSGGRTRLGLSSHERDLTYCKACLFNRGRRGGFDRDIAHYFNSDVGGVIIIIRSCRIVGGQLRVLFRLVISKISLLLFLKTDGFLVMLAFLVGRP